ncbi:hypothetical protein N657DRAFT_610208 [Parathielavia appendiculata]|uniref:Clr5 domain-containing protein n=1 Tax=Parathielavia appendiculata TaxID=2587402 RepID=A0AAN6Z8F9_9PEZI|nr:hypothetical protein N657DRAFT_610208 [Parathielavia appendiculata]
MVYRWEQHRQTCYRLYVEENKSIDEVVHYMREHHNFTPSRRAFQGAFSRWGFPNKLNPAYKNEQLVARVKELWERNFSQKDMISTLVSEGYDVGEREVTRIRFKHGWMLRANNPSIARTGSAEDCDDAGHAEHGGPNHESENPGVHEDQSNYWNYGVGPLETPDVQVQEETLEAMREARREYRKRQLEAENEERWMTKKRRRHTRAYGILPPDPPGVPPRFPSETTLTESKQILQLDPEAYKALREKFYSICVNAGVYKKTLVGPERWEALKEQLIRESMHLRAVMWDQTDIDKKNLAVEIIACDVTKRIRVESTAMHVADAKVILGLNPDQGYAVRTRMYNLLAQEKFTNKFEEGFDYFEQLKQRWIAESPELSGVVAAGPADPDYQRKMKAINVLCRDATRRYRSDAARLGRTPDVKPPTQKPATPKPRKKATPNPSAKAAGKEPAQAASSHTPASEITDTDSQATESPPPPPQPRRRGRPPGSRNKKSLPHVESRLVLADVEEPREGQQMVDPQLRASVLAASQNQDPLLDGQYGHGYAAPQHAQVFQQPQQPQPQQHQQQATPAPASSGAIAAFFRLNPAQAAMFPGVPAQWISPLSSRTMAELRSAARQKTPGALCYKIEGIVKDGKGGELPLPVSDEVELETYLQHVQGLGHGAPTFNVHVLPGVGGQ